MAKLNARPFPNRYPLAAVTAFPPTRDSAAPGRPGVDNAEVLAATMTALQATLVGCGCGRWQDLGGLIGRWAHGYLLCKSAWLYRFR